MKASLHNRIYDAMKVMPDSGCWQWQLKPGHDGYGKLKFDKKTLRAHRASWVAFRGEIPYGMLVCHTCDNPMCVNPAHLFLGSPQDNMTDKVNKGRWRGGPACWDASRLGVGHHNAKLNPEKVLQIRELLKERSVYEVAKMFHVSGGAVYAVKICKTWANVQQGAH